jgi:hypothetical protein
MSGNVFFKIVTIWYIKLTTGVQELQHSGVSHSLKMQSLRSRHKFPDKPQLYSMTVFATQCRWMTREHKTAGDINALWYRSTRRTYLSKFHEGRAVWYVTWGLFWAPQGVCPHLHIIIIHRRSLTNSPQTKHVHNARNHFTGEFKNIGSDLSLWNVRTSASFQVYKNKYQ